MFINKLSCAYNKIRQLTAGQLRVILKGQLKGLLQLILDFSFMSLVKGTPADLKQILHNVLAMVKQLADVRWQIINKLDNLELSDK